MQLYAIVLIGVLLIGDGGLGLSAGGLSGWAAATAAWAPVVVLLALTFGGVEYCRRRLGAHRPRKMIRAADRLARMARWLLLGHFAVVVLVFGWLDTVRDVVGNMVLVDEVLTLLPALVGLAATWWVYYPIERRVREAVLLRHLDMGRGVFAPPTRLQYVVTQVRLHLLFLLVPILAIIGAGETVEVLVRRFGGDGSWWPVAGEAATIAAAAAIVVAAPLLSRLVLDVHPVPDGPLRDDLLRICRVHGVKVRRLLVWNTHGAMINAAVMGLVGWLRYVLLTDALLEAMTRRQIEAVMAHEIGHVRRHHMPWLLAVLMALMVTVSLPVVWLESAPSAAVTAAVLAAAAVVLVVFGWVSRRFERQADVFAVRHIAEAGTMAGPGEPPRPAVPERVTVEAVGAVTSALEAIAELNAVERKRPSWRHGSLAWRQAYLQTLVGCSTRQLAIDGQVRWIKVVAAAVLAVAVGLAVVEAVA